MAEIQPTPSDPVVGLIDIPLPSTISLFPQTAASRVATVLLLAIAILAVRQFVRHWRVNRYRREALSELDGIESKLDADNAPEEVAASLSVLVRRTALATFPREKVAPLTGPAWLAFLDRTYDGTEFSQGPGRLLVGVPYQRRMQADTELRSLTDLVRRWIRMHHV